MITYSNHLFPHELADQRKANMRRTLLSPSIRYDAAPQHRIGRYLRLLDQWCRGRSREQAADIRAEFYAALRIGHDAHSAYVFASGLVERNAWAQPCMQPFTGAFGDGTCMLTSGHRGPCYGRSNAAFCNTLFGEAE